jgi:hypothetical protein
MKPETADPAPQGGEHGHGRASRLKARAIDEFKRFVVMFLYLWLLFGLFALHERIILREQGINFTAQGFALINALVLAKVMLVAEGFNFGRWLNRRPLIYLILYNSFLFAALFIVFHVVEDLVIGLIHGDSVRASIPVIGGGGVVGLLCVAVILFVALIPYFAVKTLNRALGPGQLKALLFEVGRPSGRRQKTRVMIALRPRSNCRVASLADIELRRRYLPLGCWAGSGSRRSGS